MIKINKNVFYDNTKKSRIESLIFIKHVKMYKSLHGYKNANNELIKEIFGKIY